METKHTPGEWFIDNEAKVSMAINSKEKLICTVWNSDQFNDTPERKEAEANAALIVLAPKMLQFTIEIQQALTDKSKFGTKLSILEFSMLNQANKILKQVK